MATDLATPSNQLVKMRWKEPYVSEGLNKKLNGIIPAGVIRGGLLVVSAVDMSVIIQDDPNTNDSIYSFIDANGHQVTFRQQGDVTLDLTAVASTTVYIGLEITYLVSAATVVKWRAFSLAEVQADPTLVILGRVDVPAVGAILAANIYPEERRDAWLSVGHRVREWKQVVKNGDFALMADGALTPSEWAPDWITTGLNTFTWQISRTDPYIGEQHLALIGGGTGSDNMNGMETVKVRGGSFVHVIFALKGVAWGGIGGNGVQGLQLIWYTQDGNFISTTYVTDNSLSGNFGWLEVSEIVEAPSNAAFMRYGVWIDTDGASPTGDLYMDAIRVFIEADQATEGHQPGDRMFRNEQFAALDLVPQPNTTSDIEQMMERTLRLWDISVGLPPRTEVYWWQHLHGKQPWDLYLKGGGIGLDRVIQTLGGDLISSLADGQEPRITLPIVTYATGGDDALTLLLETPIESGTAGKMRVYIQAHHHTSEAGGLIFTYNAEWNPSTSNWSRDITDHSYIYGVFANQSSSGYAKVWAKHHDEASASPWTDFGWDNDLWSFYGANGAEATEIRTEDWKIYADKPGTYGNPNYYDYYKNLTCPKNIVKAWGHIATGATGPTVRDGFNISLTTPPSYPNSYTMRVYYDIAFPGVNYECCVANVEGGPAEIINPDTNASYVDLAVRDDAGVINIDTVIRQLNFVVMGVHDV